MTSPERAKEVLDLYLSGVDSFREISKRTRICTETVKRIILYPNQFLKSRGSELLLEQELINCPSCRKKGFKDAKEDICVACAARKGANSHGGSESPTMKIELVGEEKQRYEQLRSRTLAPSFEGLIKLLNIASKPRPT